MGRRSIAQTTLLVFAAGIFTPGVSSSEGASACRKTDEMAAYVTGGLGPHCVRDFPFTKTVCAPSGWPIAKTDLAEKQNLNAMWRSDVAVDEDRKCATFSILIRTRDHTGTYPGYRCSSALLRAVAMIDYCPP